MTQMVAKMIRHYSGPPLLPPRQLRIPRNSSKLESTLPTTPALHSRANRARSMQFPRTNTHTRKPHCRPLLCSSCRNGLPGQTSSSDRAVRVPRFTSALPSNTRQLDSSSPPSRKRGKGQGSKFLSFPSQAPNGSSAIQGEGTMARTVVHRNRQCRE